jgi:hypothetical protein
LEREPDLYDFVQAMLAAPSKDKSKKTRTEKTDADVYRRQVRDILHSLDGMRASEAYWHVGARPSDERIKKIGR